MLKVTFEQKDNNLILKLEGHAGYAEIGKDIVCASASILACTVAQFVQEAERRGDLKSTPTVKLESGNAFISCEPTEDILFGMQDMYLFAELGYEILAQNYPQYVELKPFGAE